MQRMDFRMGDSVSSFRTSGSSLQSDAPTTGPGLLPIPQPPPEEILLTEIFSTPTAEAQSPCPHVSPNKSRMYPHVSPNAPRKKPTVWQFLPSLLIMFWTLGHGEWVHYHPSPDSTLVQVAQDGNLAGVQTALAHGADVDATCSCGCSALAWSAGNGHIAVTSFLIAKGGNVNKVDDDGDSALTRAAANQHADIVALLVSHNANVNQINSKGGTALWSAVKYRQTDMARTLLAHHADPNVAGKRGWTMLMEAVRAGSLPMVGMLLRHGARADARSLDGETASGEAVLHHRPDIAMLLQPVARTIRRPLVHDELTARPRERAQG